MPVGHGCVVRVANRVLVCLFCVLIVHCICVLSSCSSRRLVRAFLAAQVHCAAKWFNDGVDAGATILVMSVDLERRAAFILVCMC